jgi:RNA 2',3'-cyclic 3'-phosphodiesterase
LAARVATETEALGFPREARPFKAHLTIGRCKQPSDLRALMRGGQPQPAAMQVTEITLFRSHLGRGAHYEPLARFGLGQTASEPCIDDDDVYF